MLMELTYTRTRTITDSIRRTVDIPDHLLPQEGEPFVMVWATHHAQPTDRIAAEVGDTDWLRTPEPPPVIVCVSAVPIDPAPSAPTKLITHQP